MTRPSSLTATVGALALIAAAAMATTACGREGALERPGPMFGLARADEQPQARPTGAAAAETQTRNTTSDTTTTVAGKSETVTRSDTEDENAPTTKRDLRDPAQRLTPLSASPIQGLSDPLGPPVSTQPPG